MKGKKGKKERKVDKFEKKKRGGINLNQPLADTLPKMKSAKWKLCKSKHSLTRTVLSNTKLKKETIF